MTLPSVTPGRLSRRIKRGLQAASAITIAFAAFMLLVHLPAGRRLLAPFYNASCPVGAASAADIEAARVASARTTAGDAPAPSRPALGFTLETTKPADVRAWARKHGVTCKEEREGALFRCSDVPPAAVARSPQGRPLSEVVMAFEPKGMTLVNMTAYYADVSEDVAAERMSAARLELSGALGTPTQEAGSADATFFKTDPTGAAVVMYRYRDYQADLSVNRSRPGQMMVREHYMAGAPPL